MGRDSVSRRAFLKGSAISGSAILLNSIPLLETDAVLAASEDRPVRIVAPADGAVLEDFLATRLRWEYAAGPPHRVILTIAPRRDREHPIVHVTLDGARTVYAVPVLPNEMYVWQVTPADEDGRPLAAASRAGFTTGPIRLVEDAPDVVMYKNPRRNAHYSPYPPMPFVKREPLSPWYDVKSYNTAPPPKLAEIRDQLPQPVYDGHPEALQIYWYCWRIFLEMWNYAPTHPDHDAVANLNGCPYWSGWGSTMVFDSWIMSHYARYGHQAYPFITQYDNAYARQHENGFICQESDNNNFEVYACDPALVAFEIGWAELNYYRLSGDVERLRRVFVPLVKNYEWFMTYMRHNPDGIYGFVNKRQRDACGSMFSDLPYEATAYRAAETIAMARIADLIGRPDMAKFFNTEYRRLANYVNEHYWDSEYELYNDRCGPTFLSNCVDNIPGKPGVTDCSWGKFRDPKLAGKFVTHPTPQDTNKPAGIFLALFSEIAPPERVAPLKRLVRDPEKGFDWPSGIGMFSRDSTTMNYGDSTGVISPKVWPPDQYLTQEGFKQYQEWQVAREVAERYFNAVEVAYRKEHMVREALNAGKPVFEGHPDFVGWGGLAPIAKFLEYILGFDVDVPAKTIVWHLYRTERHGIQHLKMGSFYVDLICDERPSANAPCKVTVTSGGAFTLETIVDNTMGRRRIQKGTATLMVS